MRWITATITGSNLMIRAIQRHCNCPYCLYIIYHITKHNYNSSDNKLNRMMTIKRTMNRQHRNSVHSMWSEIRLFKLLRITRSLSVCVHLTCWQNSFSAFTNRFQHVCFVGNVCKEVLVSVHVTYVCVWIVWW